MSYFDRLGDVDISGLRAKLDNSKMSKLPWRLETTSVHGDWFQCVVTNVEDDEPIAVTKLAADGQERVDFDEDHAELAIAAVNVLPALLDYIETLRGALVKWRDNEMRAAFVGQETRRAGAFALVAQLNELILLAGAT